MAIPTPPESRRFSIRLRRALWIGVTMVMLVAVGSTNGQDEPRGPDKAQKTKTRRDNAKTENVPRNEAQADDAGVDLYGDPLPVRALARLGTIRLRHGQASFVFSPDSKTLLSWNHSEIRFWNPDDGALLRTLAPREFEISAIAFSRDGRSIAASGYWPDKPVFRNMVRVWDTATLAERFAGKVPPGSDGVLGVCFVDRGSTVVVASDGVVHFWNVATAANVLDVEIDKSAKSNARWVASVAVSPDEKTLAVAMLNGKLYVWNWPAGGARKLEMKSSNASLVFAPDSKLLAACDRMSSQINLCEVASGRRVRTLHGASGAAFSPDGKLMSYYSIDGKTTLLIDPGTGAEVRRIDGPERAFSPDWTLMVGRDDAGMQIWEVVEDKPLLPGRPAHTASIGGGISFSPDGQRVVTAAQDNTLRTWDAATGRPLSVLRHEGDVRGLAVSPDGRTIASSSTDDTVRLWNMTDGTERHRLAGHGRDKSFVVYYRPLAFTRDGKWLCSFGDDMSLRLWDVARRVLIAEHNLRPEGVNFRTDPPGRHGPRIQAVGLSPDASLLGLAFQQKAESVPPGSPPPTLYVWDVASGEIAGKIKLPDANIDSLIFSHDGKRIFTRAWGKIRVWSFPAGKLEKEFAAPSGTGLAAALSDDDSVVAIAVGGSERSIYLFNAADGRQIFKIAGVPDDMRSLAFSSDGRRLAVGLDSGEGLIYDVGGVVTTD